MKNYLFLSLVVIINYFVFNVVAENNYYLVSIGTSKNKEYDKLSQKVQSEVDELVNDTMNQIFNIIVDNKDAYNTKNNSTDENLNEISVISKLRKRNLNDTKIQFINNNRPQFMKKNNKKKLNFLKSNKKEEMIPFESKLVVHICPVSNYYIVIAYLTENLVEKVKALPNVINCTKSKKLKSHHTINETILNKYYNEDEILNETKWSGLSVQESPFDFQLRTVALSMMSQGIYHLNSSHPYDFNYYYPSSAGKGIDIYVIDNGLNTNLNEDDFNTYEGTPDERVIKCDGIFYNGQIHPPKSEKECVSEFKTNFIFDDSFNHGTMVSSAAIGTINGTAKKANLHMLSVEFYNYNVLATFDYIKQNAKPHKTVVNISSGIFEDEAEFTVQAIQDKVNELVEYGIIIIASAGNDNINCCKDANEVKFIYGAIDGVIKIGAVNIDGMEGIYTISDYSNFGECVDLFAPGDIIVTDKNKKIITSANGTSFSAPFVAGLAATIMSENPEIEFDYESLKNKLIELSIKNAITGLDDETPNRLANNGKQSIYGASRCDDPSGKYKCDNGCCTKSGVCVDPNDEEIDIMSCFIESGCQSEFGICYEYNRNENLPKKCGKSNKCEEDECCSEDGYCVKNYDSLCLIENGCQVEFGNCSTNKCGKDYNNRKCNEDECCSQDGECVSIYSDYCFIENGCIKEFSNECLSFDPSVLNQYNEEYQGIILAQQCQMEIDKYDVIYIKPDKRENYDEERRMEICQTHQISEYQEIIRSPEIYFPSCFKIGSISSVNNLLEALIGYNLFCSKRNPSVPNSYCIANSDKMVATRKLSEIIIADLCPYDECRETFLDFLKLSYQEMMEDMEYDTNFSNIATKVIKIYEKSIELLSTKQCDNIIGEVNFSLY